MFLFLAETVFIDAKNAGKQFLRCNKKMLEKGIVYAGSSAGSIAAGPNIEPIKFLDDPAKAPGMKSFNGLGIVDFVLLPHFNTEKYKPRYEKAIERFGSKFKLLPLADSQAAIVEN
jgi:dipeptidase E